MDLSQNYLTEQGLEKLKKELHNLINVKRVEVAERIQEAKELGDLSENAEYADAKDEQAFIEGRILELQSIIKNASIINCDGNGGVIQVGSSLKVEDEKGEQKEYQIVGSQEADPVAGKISNQSPIGRAFLGKKKGDLVEFEAPKGIIKYKIKSVK